MGRKNSVGEVRSDLDVVGWRGDGCRLFRVGFEGGAYGLREASYRALRALCYTVYK